MTYDQIAADCLEQLPGAVKAIIRKELVRSAIQLCEEANVLTQEQVAVINPGDLIVALSADAGFQALRLVSFIEPRWLPGRDYTQRTQFSIELTRGALEPANIKYKVAVQPEPGNLVLPDDLARYRDALFHCTLYRMMLTPGKSYSNAGLGSFHQNKWIEHSSTAKRHAINGQHNANRIKRLRQFT